MRTSGKFGTTLFLFIPVRDGVTGLKNNTFIATMSNYSISDGTLTTKVGTIRLDEVDYIVPRKGWLLKQYVFIGSRFGRVIKIRATNTDIEHIISELKSSNAPVMDNLDKLMEFDKATESLRNGKNKRISKNSVWLTNDYVIYVPKRKILGIDENPECIEIQNVRFSRTVQKKHFGIIPGGYLTYFGSATDQAFFRHPDKGHGEKIKEHLIDNGSVIGTQADVVYKDCFWLGKLKTPLKFFIHEEIGISDDAVIYKYKRGKNEDNIYLPFENIHYIDMEKGLFHSNYIRICGEQNIITRLEFKNKAIEAIKAILIEKAIPVADKIIQPTTFLGLIRNPFAKRTLAIVGERIIYSDSKAKVGVTYRLEQVDSIVWKKKFFLYFVGYLFIEGCYENIRQDQVSSESHQICMPKIWYKRKNYIKKLASHAAYNDKNDRKYCDIKDVKYS